MLADEENVKVVTKIVKDIPSDYESNKQELNELKERCNKLENIIKYGNITSTKSLIENYIKYSKMQLKKITIGLQLNEYSKSDIIELKDFIHYLNSICDELNNLIYAYHNNFVMPKKICECDQVIKQIINILNNVNLEKITKTDCDELNPMFNIFKQSLERYFASPDDIKEKKDE